PDTKTKPFSATASRSCKNRHNGQPFCFSALVDDGALPLASTDKRKDADASCRFRGNVRNRPSDSCEAEFFMTPASRSTPPDVARNFCSLDLSRLFAICRHREGDGGQRGSTAGSLTI